MKTSEILQNVLDVGKYLESNPPKPITNADRIRAMTDEEIAWWLITGCDGKTCPDYAVEYREDHDDASEGCRMCWLDWLKQECES